MSEEFEVFENDEDALIEYDPDEDLKTSTTENENLNECASNSSQAAFRRALKFWPLIQNQNIATKNVYVCSICLRQYDLVEDLRGHMIYYHGYKPILPNSSKDVKSVEIQGAQKSDESTTDAAAVDAKSDKETQIRPMAFKDFRLLLRAKMNMR